MNFAFPALFILLLVLPGILLRLGYFRGLDLDGAWKTPFTIQSLGDEIAWSSVFAGALHILWVLGWSHFKRPVNLANALTLLVAPTGNNGGDLVKTAIQETAHGASEVCLYFSTLVVFASALGLGAHWFVRSNGLDLRFKPLRFDNPWFYTLSGEFISPLPPESWLQWRPRWWPAGRKDHADLVQISAVVKQGSDMYIYIGSLVDYEFDRTGQLDRLVLSETSRRLLSKDKRSLGNNPKEGSHDDRFYPIESRNFIIRYSDICTLNVIYFILQETESQPDPPNGTQLDARPQKSWRQQLSRTILRPFRRMFHS